MLYHNRFNLDIGSLGALIGGQRSGGAIIHDNETTGARPTTYPSLGNPAVFRENTRAATWGFAEGSNPWDVNVNGGQLFESGWWQWCTASVRNICYDRTLFAAKYNPI